jgi:hypothetical protein
LVLAVGGLVTNLPIVLGGVVVVVVGIYAWAFEPFEM